MNPTIAPSPLFVLGCPRSGTTLLAQLLERTRWGEPAETHFITKYARRLHRWPDLRDRRQFDDLVKRILTERPVQQWRVEVDLGELYARLERFDYAEIVDQICMLRSAKLGFASWGDKTPHFILDVDFLARLFADARFLYIVRDGRDVALSLMQKPWGPGTLYHCARYWKRCNAESPAIDRLRANGQLHELRYEDLLEEPMAHTRAVYDFLEEPWDETAMMPLLAPVRRGNRDKWRSALSPAQIRLFEQIAGDTLRHFGYEATARESTPAWPNRLWWEAKDRSKLARNLVKLNVVDTVAIRFFGKEPFAD